MKDLWREKIDPERENAAGSLKLLLDRSKRSRKNIDKTDAIIYGRKNAPDSLERTRIKNYNLSYS